MPSSLGDEAARLRQRWYREGWSSSATLRDEMDSGVAAHGDTEMVFHSDLRPARARLREMYPRAQRIAAALQHLGIRAGDTVAIQVPNWLEGALAYQAAILAGAVIVPIVHIYGPAEVGFIVRESGAKALIVPDRWRTIDYLERVDRLDVPPTLEHLIVIGDESPAGTTCWRDLDREHGHPFVPPRIGPDDVCLLVYTSGTTAEPKGVQHTHNTLLAEIRAHPADPDRGSEVNLAVFPAGHIGGVLGLTRMFARGTTSVLMDAWDADDGAALVAEHRVTSTAGTPFHLMQLLDAADRGSHDISSLRSYMVGAAGVPPSLVERADQCGLAAFRAYGSSEHPPVTSGAAADPRDRRARTDGRTTPGNEIRIVDDDGRDLAQGVDGEVVARGPEQFVGYRDPALDDASFLPGRWFRTGDVGHVDGDGYLTITDRTKDIIIRGGENISSKEVEDILAAHASVAEAVAVGSPDPAYGERVAAFVILRSGAHLDLHGVREHFAARGVARQKTPERIEIVDDLPRTAAGKVKKFELRARLRDR